MKYLFNLLLIFLFASCLSTEKVAKIRNMDFSYYNHYQFYKFWRELDIFRFKNDILNIKIGVLLENSLENKINDLDTTIYAYQGITNQINERNSVFNRMKTEYSDTTDQGKIKMYERHRSKKEDADFLYVRKNDPYFELYEKLIKRTRNQIQNTSFYASQQAFETYIKKRSIEIVDQTIVAKILEADHLSPIGLSKNQSDNLERYGINFIIVFSGSYAIQYSDRAGGRTGSEIMVIKLIDVKTSEVITTANLRHFWG
jgi:hypothetical protein